MGSQARSPDRFWGPAGSLAETKRPWHKEIGGTPVRRPVAFHARGFCWSRPVLKGGPYRYAALVENGSLISCAHQIALGGTGTAPAPPPANGTNGTDGTNGFSGTNGTDGTGTQGPAGTNGANGANGQPGAAGASGGSSFKPGAVTLSGVSLSTRTLTSCAAKCASPKATLAFRVSRLSAVHLTLERLTARGWLLVGVRSFAELGGRHLIEVGQSFSGHISTAGRYRLLVLATNGHARSRAYTEELQVRAAGEL